jgi:hypothetical protein
MVGSKNRNHHRNHGCNLVEIAARDAAQALKTMALFDFYIMVDWSGSD